MSTYIDFEDITDLVVLKFPSAKLRAKIDESDRAVEDLAEEKGIRDTSEIETSPVHWLVKKYAKLWVYTEICLDAIGYNTVEIDEVEKYRIKYDLYYKLLNETRSRITPEMLTGDVQNVGDRAGFRSSLIFRA